MQPVAGSAGEAAPEPAAADACAGAGADGARPTQPGARSACPGVPGSASAAAEGLRPAPPMARWVGGGAPAAREYHARDFAWEEVRRDAEAALAAEGAAAPITAGAPQSSAAGLCLIMYA